MINNVQDYKNELRYKIHDFIDNAERAKRRNVEGDHSKLAINNDPNAKGSIRMVYYYQGQIDILNILLTIIEYIGINLDDLIN